MTRLLHRQTLMRASVLAAGIALAAVSAACGSGDPTFSAAGSIPSLGHISTTGPAVTSRALAEKLPTATWPHQQKLLLTGSRSLSVSQLARVYYGGSSSIRSLANEGVVAGADVSFHVTPPIQKVHGLFGVLAIKLKSNADAQNMAKSFAGSATGSSTTSGLGTTKNSVLTAFSTASCSSGGKPCSIARFGFPSGSMFFRGSANCPTGISECRTLVGTIALAIDRATAVGDRQ